MEWSTCTADLSRSGLKETRKTRRIPILPLIPSLLAADEHASHRPNQLPSTTLKPRGSLDCKRLDCKRQRALASAKPKRTSDVFTPKYSFPSVSPLEVPNKRDFSSMKEQSDSNDIKRTKNRNKTDYLCIGKDTASCPFLPTVLGGEAQNRVFKLRPKKTTKFWFCWIIGRADDCNKQFIILLFHKGLTLVGQSASMHHSISCVAELLNRLRDLCDVSSFSFQMSSLSMSRSSK